MYGMKEKIYIQTQDIPMLKEKINKAINLSNDLRDVLQELENYNIEFEIKSAEKETETISSQ